jgi:catechol 2,3-dioxygenase-like lactoylglutathione lyase family enzyme
MAEAAERSASSGDPMPMSPRPAASETMLPADSSFHHVGVACADLERELAALHRLGYEAAGERFGDDRQGVVGVFLEGPGPRLELLAPSTASGVLDPWLRRGCKMYHLAYEVGDLDEALARARRGGALETAPPTPAVAFAGRRISFIMLPARWLIELIERAA